MNFNGFSVFIYSKLCFWKKFWNFSETPCIQAYARHWWPYVGPISISIKDGAHVPLHENAAGILKWFGGAWRDAHDLRINGFTGSAEKPRARRMSAVNIRRSYRISRRRTKEARRLRIRWDTRGITFAREMHLHIQLRIHFVNQFDNSVLFVSM